MKRKFSIILVILLIPVLTLACVFSLVSGSGVVTSETREVNGFDRIEMSGIGTLYITQGEVESLKIEAEDNILPKIKSEVRNGILSLGFGVDDWSDIVQPTKPINYYVTVKDLTRIELSGAGRVKSEIIETASLKILSSGAGDIEINNIVAKELDVNLSGAGNCQVSGEVTNQSIDISGAGSYKAVELKSQVADVSVSGLGNVEIWAIEALDIQISGAGSVRYYGSPGITQEVSGAGSIKSLGER
jgi:hypothetical protein